MCELSIHESGERQVTSEPLLVLEHVDAGYGNIQALDDVSLHVKQGELVALLGANGAGKTTALRVISGLMRPRKGRVSFQGRDIARAGVHEIVQMGIAHCPEGRQIFARLTVKENLRMGAYLRRDPEGVARDLEWIFEHFPVLRDRLSQSAGTLSGGEQQMLAIGRALMSKPTLLLLDEPSLGLAPIIVDRIFKVIAQLKEQGKTIFLVEQNAFKALEIADRAYVLESGRIRMKGRAQELMANEDIKHAYLGG
ncbi:high-affinity branched-chain amino acid transport ATP-binding protein LivF [Moorella thermoacetica]|uniref:High-affinity branched-chain amino acid transport ATP-binding protein LivF n=1 Tax=Neomoorella thermoacetica TaxID=1525 RepID=A0A1J5N6Y5_NEOTH|nr:high-affinity branched-chain amino acid transport ATP-binding protein LivF [Moorella thermoacetica]